MQTPRSGVNIERGGFIFRFQMLLIHDIVEVDVGDTPIHWASSPSEQI